MAHIVRIAEYDSTNTLVDSIDLVDAVNGMYLLEYTMKIPQERVTETNSPVRSGESIAMIVYSDVSESLTFLASKTTDPELDTVRQDVQRFFNRAKQRTVTKRGNHIYFMVQLDRTSTLYRSRIKFGQVSRTATFLDDEWGNRKVKFIVTMRRDYYWEEATETEIPLASKQNTKTTGGVTVYNHWDSDTNDGNYVHIASTDLNGDIPVPPRLSLYNSYDNPGRPTSIYVSRNETGTPGSVMTTIEAESGIWYSSPATVTNLTSVNYSGGAARSSSWSGTSEYLLAQWSITGTTLTQLNGIACRMIARFTSTPTANTWLRMQLNYSVTDLESSTEVKVNSNEQYQDIGTLHFPPWRTDGLTSLALDLRLYARNPDGIATISLDCINLLPLDSEVRYTTSGYGVPYTYAIIDNPQDDIVTMQAGSTSLGLVTKRPHTEGMMLSPGVDQRLHFMQVGGGSQIDRTLAVRAWYRPRYLVI